MKIAKLLSLAAISSAVAFTSCKKDDNNDNGSTNNTGNGSSGNTMKVRMTDSPGNFSAFNTTVTRVEAYVENHGWITLDSSNHAMNVLSLTNGSESTVANNTSAMSGHYTKLRLTMGSNSSISTNDQSGDNTYTLNWAGSTDHTVEVNIDANVSSTSGSSVLLDYNVGSSIASAVGGSWTLTPMVTWVQDESTGVKGDVNGAVRGMVTFMNGVHSYSTYMSNQGMFMIRGMQDGTYTMIIDGQATANGTTTSMQQQNVVIVSGQIKNMGTINFQ